MNKRKYKSSYLMKQFLPYYAKYKHILILDLLCASLTTVMRACISAYCAKYNQHRIAYTRAFNRTSDLNDRAYIHIPAPY